MSGFRIRSAAVWQVDIAVVGGGPAGALTAWLLARSRPASHIVVLEKHPIPAHKPCGEFLAPPGCSVLERAGLLGPMLAGGLLIDRLALFVPGGSIGCRMGSVSLGIRREQLDAMLLAKAAERCEVRMGIRVEGVERVRNTRELRLRGADGPERLSAGLLIGADSRHSGIRRWAGLGTTIATG